MIYLIYNKYLVPHIVGVYKSIFKSLEFLNCSVVDL